MNTLRLPATTANSYKQVAIAHAESLLSERCSRYIGELHALETRMARWGCEAEAGAVRNEIALVQGLALGADADTDLERLPEPGFRELARRRARFSDYVQLVLNNWPDRSRVARKAIAKSPRTVSYDSSAWISVQIRALRQHLASWLSGKPSVLVIPRAIG